METVKEAPEVKASESVQLGGMLVDSGKESFSVDLIGDAKKAEAGKKEQVADPPAAPEVEAKGADEKKEGEGKEPERESKLEVKHEDDTSDIESDDKVPVGVKKRFDKLTRQREDAKREADLLRAENAELKAAQAKEAIDAEEPDITKFETEADFLKALTAYQVKKELATKDVESTKKAKEDIEQEQDKAKADRHEAIQKGLKAAESKYDDFKKLVYEAKDTRITEQMVDIMLELPNMGEVVYQLAKDPKKAAEIADLNPARQAFRLKEISDSIKSKKITKAPAPIRAIGATGGDIKALADMSYPEYKALRDKQDKEKRGG
jgi:hypothetical protein